jgi:putative PIN family toxin of toxin-antitoxin system
MSNFVLDTNVIVSSLLFSHSIPRKALDKALDTGKILISQEIILELTQVLNRNKLNKYLLKEERLKFLADFLKDVKTVTIYQKTDACRDKKDNKFLALVSSNWRLESLQYKRFNKAGEFGVSPPKLILFQ